MGKSLSLLKDGTHGSYESVQQGAWLLSAKNIINNRVVITSNDRKISENDFKKIHDKFQLRKGDVLLTIVGTIGRSAILKEANKLTFQRSVAYLRPDENILTSSNFLFSLSKSSNFQNQLKKRTVISAQPGIYLSDIDKLNITIPELKEEQDKIASIIITIDNILSLQQRKLEQLKQLKKALLQQLFVGKNNKQPNLRFKNFDGEWEQCMLKEIKDVRDGTHNSPRYQKEGYPLVTSKNLITNGIDLSNVSFISKYDYQEINKRSKVETGDILFGMIGTIGNPVMVKKGGFAIKNVALIKNGGEVSNGFLLHLLKSAIFSQYIKKENAGGTQKFLGLSVIRSFKFKVPDKVEQGNIASIFDTLNRFITLQQNKLTQLTTLKKYLLQKLFI